LKNTDPVTALPAPNAPATSDAPKPANPATPPSANAPPPEKHDTRSSVATGELGGSEDEQLTQALDMLRGLKLVSAARTGQ
jgi:hypothetical protein